MKWFKHHTDSHADAKVRKLTIRYGAEGYALYWYCLELIAGKLYADRLTFELEHDAELIAHELKIDSARVVEIMAFMVRLGLFECDQNNIITCLKLARHLDERYAWSDELKAIIKVAKKGLLDRQTLMMLTSASSDANKIPDENIALLSNTSKKINGAEYAADFLLFWKAWPLGFGSKGAKAAAHSEWRKARDKPPVETLIRAAQSQAEEKASRKRNGQFVENFKHVCRWLKGREWENEVVIEKRRLVV